MWLNCDYGWRVGMKRNGMWKRVVFIGKIALLAAILITPIVSVGCLPSVSRAMYGHE